MIEFLKILVAWAFFAWGVMLLVIEIHTYIETSGENTLLAGDWGVLLRWFLLSSSFAIWFWILFR